MSRTTRTWVSRATIAATLILFSYNQAVANRFGTAVPKVLLFITAILWMAAVSMQIQHWKCIYDQKLEHRFVASPDCRARAARANKFAIGGLTLIVLAFGVMLISRTLFLWGITPSASIAISLALLVTGIVLIMYRMTLMIGILFR